jgi:hypothetical protein
MKMACLKKFNAPVYQTINGRNDILLKKTFNAS